MKQIYLLILICITGITSYAQADSITYEYSYDSTQFCTLPERSVSTSVECRPRFAGKSTITIYANTGVMIMSFEDRALEYQIDRVMGAGTDIKGIDYILFRAVRENEYYSVQLSEEILTITPEKCCLSFNYIKA